MAYTKSTLTNLIQSLADRHDSGVYPTSSQVISFWTRLLNRGQAYCADVLGMTKQTTLTTVSGTIALPDDFVSIDSVFEGTTEYTNIYQYDQATKDMPNTFWITGNHTSGFYLNTRDDIALTVSYVYRPADMVATTDVCFIPDPEAVVAHAYAFLRKSETDPIEDADSALQECDSRLKDIIDAQVTNSGFTGFTIQD